MGVEEIVAQMTIALFQLGIGLVISVGSVYIGLKLFDRLTGGIDEWREIKKGNVAVGILLAAIIFSIAMVIQSGVSQITSSVKEGATLSIIIISFGLGLITLILSVIFAVISIYISIRVLDKITVDIDEFGELQKGNVAIAILMAGIILAISFVISGAVLGIVSAVDAETLSLLMG